MQSHFYLKAEGGGGGGRVSDKQITIDSGFLKKLHPGDCVLADRGFLIEDELVKHGTYLKITKNVALLERDKLAPEGARWITRFFDESLCIVRRCHAFTGNAMHCHGFSCIHGE